jgi:hypothetical protein
VCCVCVAGLCSCLCTGLGSGVARLNSIMYISLYRVSSLQLPASSRLARACACLPPVLWRRVVAARGGGRRAARAWAWAWAGGLWTRHGKGQGGRCGGCCAVLWRSVWRWWRVGRARPISA